MHEDLIRRARELAMDPELREAWGALDEAADALEAAAHNQRVLTDALWKSCGDDEQAVLATIESQGELR